MVDESHSSSNNTMSRVILKSTKDDGNQQLISYDGLEGEQHTDVVKVQQYGFSFHAPPGAEGVVINMNGSRDNPMVIGVEMPDQRPTGMPEGGVRVYDGSGSYVDFNNGGTVTIKCDKLVIDCPDINLGGEGGVPASKEGTIDTGGFADVSSLSTRVKII